MRIYVFTLLIHAIAFYTLMLISQGIANAHAITQAPQESEVFKPVIGDLHRFEKLNIPILSKDKKLGVAFAYIDSKMEEKLHLDSHADGKCGAFESLESESSINIQSVDSIFQSLNSAQEKNERYLTQPFQMKSVDWKQEVQQAADQVKESELENWVKWLSSFPDRYNKAKDPNKHIAPLMQKIEAMTKLSPLKTEISTIDHKTTPQKSIRVRILGKDNPGEIVVLGGHLDSINQRVSGGLAPGADDNASGSANILEALRISLTMPQPKRTLEFFLYAGEESGLLGSAEIAKNYKQENKNVVAVLQLDMTLFPGEGEFVIGSVEDFTSAWLRDYLVSLNQLYLKLKIVGDKCGYGCSDHASWFRQGYSTLLPFEATTSTMNHNIHTDQDLINSQSSFKHSVAFAKLAVVFAQDLGNSDLRAPL